MVPPGNWEEGADRHTEDGLVVRGGPLISGETPDLGRNFLMGCPTLAVCAHRLGTGHTLSLCGLARSEAGADSPQRLAKPGHPSGWL